MVILKDKFSSRFKIISSERFHVYKHIQRGSSLVKISVLLQAVVVLTTRYQHDDSLKKDTYFNKRRASLKMCF